MGEMSPSLGSTREGLRPIAFSEIAGWEEDDHTAAFAAFRVGARRIAQKPPKTRLLGIDGGGLSEAAHIVLGMDEQPDRPVARRFFEWHFRPHRIEAPGSVTGYFEPEVAASRVPTARFKVPLYRRPDDLCDVTDANRPPGWDAAVHFARRAGEGIEPYFDRGAIEDGALDGRGLEIAWIESPTDAFFIHVQGSARLRLADGTTMRIGFDGKSGHAYTSIGRLAVERGVLSRERTDKDGLEAWLKSHPAEGRALMRENRSYIFFRETGQSEAEGPLGAAGVPLTPWRSLAVDRGLHTFHAPIWVEAPALFDPERAQKPFRRLMIAQDTGSAIVGPTRGDIFCGSGARAGSIAGRIRHDAAMIVLVPTEVSGAE
jgi:membrane-bound lytic murein transglycosylase A